MEIVDYISTVEDAILKKFGKFVTGECVFVGDLAYV